MLSSLTLFAFLAGACGKSSSGGSSTGGSSTGGGSSGGGSTGGDSGNNGSGGNGTAGGGSGGSDSSAGGSGGDGTSIAGAGGDDSGMAGSAGDGPDCPVGAMRNGPYERVTVIDETSTFGLIDPSIEYPQQAESGLLTYTAVPGFDRVHIAIASSADQGATWTRVGTVTEPTPITIATTDDSICGSTSCDGTLVFESSSVILDPSDPDPERLVKVFSHAYFFGVDRHFEIGYIAMHTASGPEGPWEEVKLFGWDSSSPLSSSGVTHNVSSDPALAELHECVIVGEPGAIVRPTGTIDLVLACPAPHPGGGATIDIRLLRSNNHGESWEYVASMLTPDDAESLGAASNKINGGDLFYTDGSYYLIATPLGLVEFPEGTDEGYRGCLVIPVEDLDTGAVSRCDGIPVVEASYLGQPGQFVGACSADEGASASGMLIPVPDLTSSVPFQLFSSEFPPQ